MEVFNGVYKGKRVLVTGHTGFKGAWLTSWLIELGAEVYGIADGVPTEPSLFKEASLKERIRHFETDIRSTEEVRKILAQVRPDFVFHLAAQALVRLSYRDPLLTLETNILGTANLLDALREHPEPCQAIIVTSDKCYDNTESIWGYRESDPLGGKDPYSASKGGAELVVRTYTSSYFADEDNPIRVAVGRAGNVIGGGDWAIDRIVPDCVRACSRGERVEIRRPEATRPWQHVLEPLSGYLLLGAQLAENPSLNGEAFNFGPPGNQNYSVRQLLCAMQKSWSKIAWEEGPLPNEKFYEAGLLKLCCDKALHLLQWQSTLDFQETVQFTVDWYRKFYEGAGQDIGIATGQQIRSYMTKAEEKGLSWTRS